MAGGSRHETTRGYRNLDAWKHAIDLGPGIYGLVRRLPSEERFGMADQLRRACVSVAANIAEGHARSPAEFVRYLKIARGSLAELDTIIVMAERIGYFTEAETCDVHDRMIIVRKIIQGLIRSNESSIGN